jgi:tetratricopeptide (TPR) repeat protein
MLGTTVGVAFALWFASVPNVDTLPDSKQDLLDESDRSVELGPSLARATRSYRAARVCVDFHNCEAEGTWRLARALYLLTLVSPTDRVGDLTKRCLELHIGPNDPPEVHFYTALCMGARARARKLEALALITQMVEKAKTAALVDPRIGNAGPDRLLGGIYLRAPGWPLSVGDRVEAIAHLEKAVTLGPRWPENHLMLAEALINDGRLEDARAAFRRAKRLIEEPEVKGWRDVWRDQYASLEQRLADR